MTLLRALTDRIAELEAQRDQVLALAGEAKVGMTQHCWCPGGDDGPVVHWASCKGPQPYWDLDPDAVRAIYGPEPEGPANAPQPSVDASDGRDTGSAKAEPAAAESDGPLGYYDADGCPAREDGVHFIGVFGECACGWRP